VRKRTSVVVGLVAVALTVGAAAPAASAGTDPAATPGVTDDEIRISVIAGFSGGLAQLNKDAVQGLETWADQVNDAGGIGKRTIALEQIDHKDTADGGVAACKEAQSNDTLIALVPEGNQGANITAVDCLDKAGIPSLYFAPSTNPKLKQAFSYIPTSEVLGASSASFIKNVLKGGKKKIGTLYENEPSAASGEKAFVKAAKKAKLDVVDREAVEPDQGSFVPQLTRLQQAGAEVVLLSTVQTSLGIFPAAKQIGYDPQFTGGGFTFDFLSGILKDSIEGTKGLRFSATTDAPSYKKYAALMEKYGRGRTREKDNEGFLYYGLGLLTGEALAKAGTDPTRASFVAGAETIHDFQTGILPPITYGKGDHVGADAAYPATCCDTTDWVWKSAGPPKARF
jgi:branched-chain amino acid transport system substrate-binding protein